MPEWWAALPEGERKVLGEVRRMFRGLKRSRVPQVARAAVKWERGIGCFIKVRLMQSFRTGSFRTGTRRRTVDSRSLRVEGCEPHGPKEPGPEVCHQNPSN